MAQTTSTVATQLNQKLIAFFNDRMAMLHQKFESDVSQLETMKYVVYDTCVIPINDMLYNDTDTQQQQQPLQQLQQNVQIETAPNVNTNTKKKLTEQQMDIRAKTPTRPVQKKQQRERPEKSADRAIPAKKAVGDNNLTKTAEKLNKTKTHFHNNTHLIQPAHGNAGKSKDINIRSKDVSNDRTSTTRRTTTPGIAGQRNKAIAVNKKHIKAKETKKHNINSIKAGNNNNNTPTHSSATKHDNTGAIASTTTTELDQVSDFNEHILKTNINKVTIPKEQQITPLIPIPPQLNNNQQLQSIYIMLTQHYLPSRTMFNIVKANTLLYNAFNCDLAFILQHEVDTLSLQIQSIENLFSKYNDIDNYISKTFYPSKTAQNSLSFVTKAEEANLIKKNDLHNDIGLLFKLVYIIIDEEYEDDTPPNKLIENLVNVVFPKYEVSDVKNLLLNYVNKNKGIKIDDKKYTKMSNIIETNSKILTSMHMARLNRPISYLTFFVKEAYDYVKLQTSDGVYYYELRNKSEKLSTLKERVDVLKKLIEQHKKEKE